MNVSRAEYYRWYRQTHGALPRAEYDKRRHRHPSLNCYKRHQCRCDGCRRWNAFDVSYRTWRRSWDEQKLERRRALGRLRSARYRARNRP